MLRSLGLKLGKDQLETLIQAVNENNNGTIEFSEFISLVSPDLIFVKCHYSKEQLKKLFKMFDIDCNGLITVAQLSHSTAKLGHALTFEELTGMSKEADTNGDGCISFQEFAQAITSAAFDNCWT